MFGKIVFILSTVMIYISSLAGEPKPVLVKNKGIGGNNTANALARIDRDVLAVKPDCLIIEFGGNDALNSRNLVEPEQFAKNIDTIIRKAKEAKIRVIALITPTPVIEKYLRERHSNYPFQENLNERIEKYYNIVKDSAKRQNIILIDFNQLLKKHGGATEDAGSLIRNIANSKSSDGIHPTAAGYKLLGQLAARELAPVIKPGDTVICFGDSITYGANLKGAGTVHGDNYPTELQRLLNKKLGTSKQLAAVEAQAAKAHMSGNFVLNGDFKKPAAGKMPANWVLAKHNNDTCEQFNTAVENFMRISAGKPGAVAFVRNDLNRIASGKYAFSCKLRGTGNVAIGLSTYSGGQPVHKIIGQMDLTGEWKPFKCPVEIGQKINRFCISFKVKNSADIAQVEMAASQTEAPKFTKTISVSNENIALKLALPEQGGGIISIRNSSGREFINKTASGELWRITFKGINPDAAGLPEIIDLSIDPEKDDGTSEKSAGRGDLVVTSKNKSAKCEKTVKPGFVKFTWSGIDVGGDKKCLDVWVSLTLDKDSFCRINSGFENRSRKYTVFYFMAPVVEGLGGLGQRPDRDYLATPAYNGRLINNPVNNGLLRKNRIFQPNRSGHSMQFDAYYNSGNGLYLGCFDGNLFAKRYQIESHPHSGLSWALGNIPDNMRKVPQKWDVPYPAVLRCFAGDWYDACQIYRKWALKQYWCGEGALTVRTSTPKWFKEIDEWLSLGLSGAFTAEFKKMVKDFGKYKLGVMCFYWGKWHVFGEKNPDRFPLDDKDRGYLTLMKKNKISAMGYIQCTGWCDSIESFKKNDGAQNVVRNYLGQAIRWPKKKGVPDNELIAYPGKTWTRVLGDTVVKMAEAGFSAAYLDSGNHGGTYLNFTPECSNDSGGGNGYIKGNQQLIQTLRQRARKINPDFCFTAESFWEGNIGVLDAFLACNTTNIYLSGRRVTAIPMAQTVYHDYTLMYSVWPSRWDVERDSARGYIAKHGLAFTWGVKPGWNILTLLYKYKNHELALASSLKRYEAYSRSKKFLVYGQMLRKPEIVSPNEFLPVKWHISYSKRYYEVDMPAVLCSAWRAPDGKLGLVFYNISDKARQLKLKLNRKEYGLPESGGLFTGIYPGDGQLKLENSGDNVILTVSIPAAAPAVYELK